MISYSQNFEDIILNRCFKNKTTGFYIDIGAAHPDICSCTKHFYQQGWHGINVDPQAAKILLFNKNRSRDININAAISHKNGTQEFYEVEDKAFGYSSLHYKYIERLNKLNIKYEIKTVLTLTLDQIIEKYNIAHCDFINIDCEGNEEEVLRGWKNKNFLPTVLLIESVEPMISIEDNRTETHQQWEFIILNKGYKFVYADGINRFYLHDSRKDLLENFQFPPNVLDGFQPVTEKYYRKYYKEMKSLRTPGILQKIFNRL